MAITHLDDTWPKSAAPRASQSDVFLSLPMGESFSVLNHQTHLCSWQEPSFFWRATQRERRRQGEEKVSISPFLGTAWDSTLPSGHKAATAAHPPLLTAAAEASCQTPAHWKTFVLRYKNQWLTAAHVVSSVVNLSSAWYCLHMATRLSELSIPMRCSDSQRFPDSCVNWKQHSQLICFNRSLSNPHRKDTNQILSFF